MRCCFTTKPGEPTIEPAWSTRTARTNRSQLGHERIWVNAFDRRCKSWSYYDTRGNLARLFYHRLNMAQLRKLELSFLKHAVDFIFIHEMFEKQVCSRSNNAMTVALKGHQKLRRPPEAILR